MLFDVNNLFFHTGTAYQFTAGEFVSVVGQSSACASGTINMGVAQDLGIGDGEFVPKVSLTIGNAITSSCASLKINTQFQGSTDSSTWTTYAESGALSTASYAAQAKVFPIDVPHRPPGVSFPQYYRINLALTGNANSETISTGTIIGGLVIQREDNPGSNYPSGFTVA